MLDQIIILVVKWHFEKVKKITSITNAAIGLSVPLAIGKQLIKEANTQ